MSKKLINRDFSFIEFLVPLSRSKPIPIIIIIGIVVFFNSLFNGFVWDDLGFVLNNPDVEHLNLFQLFQHNSFNSDSFYRPISALYFAILHAFFTNHAFPYHLVQIAIHTANTCVLYLIFQQIFNKQAISLFLSLVFLVHPIQVESVSYIAASASSPLFFLFGITALFLSLKDEINSRRLTLITILLVLSVLTKETGGLFVGIILLFRLLFVRKKALHFLITGVFTLSLYTFLRFTIGKIFLQRYVAAPIAQLSIVERIFNIPGVIFYYMKTFFFPMQLVFNQQWIIKYLDFYNFYFPLLIIILFSIISIGLYKILDKKETMVYCFFWFWMFTGSLMFIQLVPLEMTVADRWFYFPLAGLLGIVGSIINAIGRHIKIKPDIVISFCIAVLIFLSLRTIIRNTNWKNNLTLYSHDSKILTNGGIENDLGLEYAKLSEYDKAIAHYYNAIATIQCEDIFYNLGLAYEQKGDKENAKKYYHKAIQSKHCKLNNHNHNLNTYKRMALILMQEDLFQEAKKYLIEGVDDFPDSSDLWGMFAVTQYNLKNQSEALEAAVKAKTIMPNKYNEYIYMQILENKPIEL